MKLMKILAFAAITSMATGCANAPIVINYTPSSTMSVDGELKVGNFRYLPGENNSRIKSNQIRNTAIGNVLFEKNIDEYFETALFTESRFVGIEIKDSSNTVSGEIIEFLIDDLGYNVDWTLEVKYQVSNSDNSECYSKVHKFEKKTAKFANVFGTLNEIMKLNIEQAFKDETFVSCIASKS
jgi:hypothetical protein